MRILILLCPLALMSGQIILTPANPSVPSGKSITLTSSTPVNWSLSGSGTLSNATPTSVSFTAPTGIVPKNQMLGCPIGPNDSIFNTRIDGLPVNPRSAAWISGSTTIPTNFETTNWGISIADASTPSRTLRTYYSGATIPNFVMPPAGPNLKRQGGAYVGGFGFPSAPDHHVMTVRYSDCSIYESYDDYIDGYTRNCRDGSPGCNSQSAVTYKSMDYGVPGPDGGTNAGGLPLAPTTWQLSEIENGSINHATIFTTNLAAVAFAQYIWPASATAGGCANSACPNAMPMGTRLRLKSSFNASAVCNSGVAREDAACNTMLTALKQYGMILCDTGSANAVEMLSEVTEDPMVGEAVEKLISAQIPFSSFEAVDESSLEVSASSYQVCPLGETCANGTNSYVSPSDQAVVTATNTGGTKASMPIGIQGVAIGLGVPSIVGIAAGNYSYQIPAWVNGAANQAISWSLISGSGSISANGVYNPPAATAGPGVTDFTILKGVSVADPAATTTLRLNILPVATNGAVRIDTGSPVSTTDANGNVWAADIGIEGGARANPSDYPHWNQSNVPANIVYESLQSGDDLGHTLIVPNGSYDVHLLFGKPVNGDCSGCTSWLNLGWWNQYDFAPYILESQGQLRNATFDFGALTGYLLQKPADAHIPATVTNNLLQVYVRSVMSDRPPYLVPLDSAKHTLLNGVEITPASAPTVTPSPAPAPVAHWRIDTTGQTMIAPGQTLQPFAIVDSGSGGTDPTWSILTGPTGASLNGSTLSLSSTAATNGQAIVVQASDGTNSATASIATKTATAIPRSQVASGFTYSREVTISHAAAGNSDLDNFPIVISISDPQLKSQDNGGHVTNANGYDLVLATDSAGLHPLAWEVEQYDGATGTLVAHVSIPTLSHSEDTTIYLLYGNSQITTSQANAAAVWNSGFTGVYHFERPPLAISDSTAHLNAAVESNGSYQSTGLLAGAAGVSTGNIGLPAGVLGSPAGTVEMWVSTSVLFDKARSPFLSRAGGNSQEFFRLGWDGKVGQLVAVWSTPQSGSGRMGFNAVQDPTASPAWTYVAYTWDDNDNLQSLYLNGVLLGSMSGKVPIPTLSGTSLVELGSGSPAVRRPADETLDEVRFSNIVRSSDWIAASFNAEGSPAITVTVSGELGSNNTN